MNRISEILYVRAVNFNSCHNDLKEFHTFAFELELEYFLMNFSITLCFKTHITYRYS